MHFIKREGKSIYGKDMLGFVAQAHAHAGSFYKTVEYLLTHGNRYPVSQALESLGLFDHAAFQALASLPTLRVLESHGALAGQSLRIYMNSLGRLHIRPAAEQPICYYPEDHFLHVGYVTVPEDTFAAIHTSFDRSVALEHACYQQIKSALDRLHTEGSLPQILDEVTDHVAHVESVCFYVGNRFLARIDQFSNLIATQKENTGFLNRLHDRDYSEWSKDDILVVAALHALFLSGKAVRFEEFNGATLTATGLLKKLRDLLRLYQDSGCTIEMLDDGDLFRLAQLVREQSLKSVGSNWLRYRWIYGLTFQKNERVLPCTLSTEDPLAHTREFSRDFEDFHGRPCPARISEAELFKSMAHLALDRDLLGIPCGRPGSAANSWLEYLMERIVVSAILATNADYGMSSSLRSIGCLLESDELKLIRQVHALQPADFYTCFVSTHFASVLPRDVADAIALSIQRRMMFNRWHFIPGNFEPASIAKTRHWYYPPVIPDIAIHSDIHRASHAKAHVKFSIRAPGPDMSMPPLIIAGRPYRGFYDIRVVRMEGMEFTTEEMLRVRRRTIWMGAVYSVFVERWQKGESIVIQGFRPGEYLDLAGARS